MNDHRFEDSFVRRVYETCVAAGIDYMELGYKADRKIFTDSKAGPWKFCTEDDLRRIVGDAAAAGASAATAAAGNGIKLSVMADAERTDYHTDILPREHSVLSCIRVAAYVHQVPTALDMIKDAHDKGYETTFTLMALSTVQDLFVPLRKELDWGYSIPYMLTGQLNIHPRMAIELRESSTPDDYVGFYDSLTEDTD